MHSKVFNIITITLLSSILSLPLNEPQAPTSFEVAELTEEQANLLQKREFPPVNVNFIGDTGKNLVVNTAGQGQQGNKKTVTNVLKARGDEIDDTEERPTTFHLLKQSLTDGQVTLLGFGNQKFKPFVRRQDVKTVPTANEVGLAGKSLRGLQIGALGFGVQKPRDATPVQGPTTPLTRRQEQNGNLQFGLLGNSLRGVQVGAIAASDQKPKEQTIAQLRRRQEQGGNLEFGVLGNSLRGIQLGAAGLSDQKPKEPSITQLRRRQENSGTKDGIKGVLLEGIGNNVGVTGLGAGKKKDTLTRRQENPGTKDGIKGVLLEGIGNNVGVTGLGAGKKKDTLARRDEDHFRAMLLDNFANNVGVGTLGFIKKEAAPAAGI